MIFLVFLPIVFFRNTSFCIVRYKSSFVHGNFSVNEVFMILVGSFVLGHTCNGTILKVMDALGITYTVCPRRNVPDFGRVFLMLKYTDITQNTYVQS